MAVASGIAGVYITHSEPSGGTATVFFGLLSLATLVAATVSIMLGEGVGEIGDGDGREGLGMGGGGGDWGGGWKVGGGGGSQEGGTFFDLLEREVELLETPGWSGASVKLGMGRRDGGVYVMESLCGLLEQVLELLEAPWGVEGGPISSCGKRRGTASKATAVLWARGEIFELGDDQCVCWEPDESVDCMSGSSLRYCIRYGGDRCSDIEDSESLLLGSSVTLVIIAVFSLCAVLVAVNTCWFCKRVIVVDSPSAMGDDQSNAVFR
eukprot:jgi/Undpi1/14219/HiC_scaffold_9.g03868.m1